MRVWPYETPPHEGHRKAGTREEMDEAATGKRADQVFERGLRGDSERRPRESLGLSWVN